VNVVYNCHIPDVMGYPERGYCFCSGNDAFLMWDGYLSDLMYAMWRVYGWEPDPDDPAHPHLDQVPLLREWNENGLKCTHGPMTIAELKATARAVRDAQAELNRAGPNLAESPRHGDALAAFLEQAAASDREVSVEVQWG
jgi:hypothetical protein